MKLEQLHYFIKVVECHSFNKAAHELYMTQPALTKSIQSLENDLGVQLLHRTKSGTYPTNYGLQVYNDCKTILDDLDEKILSWQSFKTERKTIIGTVHLAAIPVLCNLILEQIIDGIHQTHPEIELMLHDIPMESFPDELLRGRFNVGITSVTLDQTAHQRKRYQAMHFNAQPLLKDDYCIYLSSHHPFAKKDALSYDDIEHLKLITYSSNQPITFSSVFAHFGEVQYLNSIGNILQAVADNKGATVLMRKATKNNWYVKHGFICEKSVKSTTIMPNEHVLICAEEALLTAAEKAVAAYVQEHYTALYSET